MQICAYVDVYDFISHQRIWFFFNCWKKYTLKSPEILVYLYLWIGDINFYPRLDNIQNGYPRNLLETIWGILCVSLMWKGLQGENLCVPNFLASK